MKAQKITILAGLLFSTMVHATMGLPQMGPKPKTKITLTDAQIQAIKNEMHGLAKTKNENILGLEKSEDLEDILQLRLAEVSDITNFKNNKSFENALTFMGLALQAWNPELRNVDIKKQIVKNIVAVGFVQGFIYPAMALIDKSYAIGYGGYGDLLNTMLADITPDVASALKNQYGAPTDFNGRDFTQITAQGRQGIWIGLLSQLDPDFYKDHNKSPQSTESTKVTPVNRDFIDININGDKTAIAHYLKKMGHTDKSESLMQKRRLFQSSLGVNASECAWKCVEEVVTEGSKGSTFGKGVGEIIQKHVPLLRNAGMIIGASHGIDKCIGSSECGGSKEQRAEEKAAKEVAAKEKEAQDQKYRDAMDDYRKQEASKQLEIDKKDGEKLKHLQQMKDEFEKQKKENQESDDDDESDEETFKAQDEHNRNGRDIKQMLVDDESSGATFEEVQNMKKNLGMPMIPDEVVTENRVPQNKYDWVTKIMEKEISAKPIEVNLIYPTNPNWMD